VAIKRRRSFDPKSFPAETGKGRTIDKYGKDQVVFSQGDPADAVFYILKGRVKVAMVSEQGKEVVIAIHGPDNFFGYRCLAGLPCRSATVTALTESVIMRLEKATILCALHAQSKFSEMFITHLLKRFIRVEADLVDQLFNSSEERLARLLLLLADFEVEEKPESVIVNVTHEMLAEKIGTTRARVSYFMNKFRRLGFIDYNGGIIHVHGSRLNLILHDEPQNYDLKLSFRAQTRSGPSGSANV
jgi:CRP-like cAMP-binding protein